MTDYKKKKLWVVSHVEEKAKDEAKRLAKLSKKKIGPWLSELILNRKSPSQLDIAGQLYSSNDMQKIITCLDKIKMEIHDINLTLSNLEFIAHPLPKKTFFDKFLK